LFKRAFKVSTDHLHVDDQVLRNGKPFIEGMPKWSCLLKRQRKREGERVWRGIYVGIFGEGEFWELEEINNLRGYAGN
jgi:hypothetical protein